MKDETIKCDYCLADITYTDNSIDYRLHLLSESMPSKNAVITNMMTYNPLLDDKHFCGIDCLKQWCTEK